CIFEKSYVLRCKRGNRSCRCCSKLYRWYVYVFPVAYLYRKHSGINSIVIGLTIGTVVMAVVMTILNYFIILPAYGMFVGVGFTDTAKWIAVIGGVLPFNF